MIEINKITNGSMNGKIVWVCDLRYTDYSNKAIRHVKPTKVMIRSNDETKKRIYYSKSHFVCLNKDGKPLKSKVIGVFDATGYRTYPGVPLGCFETEKECVESYQKSLDIAIKGFENHKQQKIWYVDRSINNLKQLKKDY